VRLCTMQTSHWYYCRRPLPFLICINNLPPTINSKTKPILFIDGIKLNSMALVHERTIQFSKLPQWCLHYLRYPKANKLALNFDKVNIIQFMTHRTSAYINNRYENTKTEKQLISWITNSQSHQVAKHTGMYHP
jgi:hypothetical protein